MTPQEIASVASSSSSKPILLGNAVRLIFACGPRTLVLDSDGNWTCYLDVCGGTRPEQTRADFASLRHFLQSQPATSSSENSLFMIE